eukprot:scaffold320739_cov36-Tisochrysis_lutea.AAC.1
MMCCLMRLDPAENSSPQLTQRTLGVVSCSPMTMTVFQILPFRIGGLMAARRDFVPLFALAGVCCRPSMDFETLSIWHRQSGADEQ